MRNKLINDDIRLYFHSSLGMSTKDNFYECYYHRDDKNFSIELRKSIGEVIAYLAKFYKIRELPKMIIFIYPELSVMNQAFKRELPSDQCCFVPVKGKISLITFTSKIGKDNLKQVLAHEISHIIFSILSGNEEENNIQQTKPVWLDEGLALHIDSKYRANMADIEKKRVQCLKEPNINYFPNLSELYTYFNRLDDDVEFGSKGTMAYAYSYFCVSNLLNQFGSEKIVDFVKMLSGKDAFNDLFLESFGKSLQDFNFEMERMILTHEYKKHQNEYINERI